MSSKIPSQTPIIHAPVPPQSDKKRQLITSEMDKFSSTLHSNLKPLSLAISDIYHLLIDRKEPPENEQQRLRTYLDPTEIPSSWKKQTELKETIPTLLNKLRAKEPLPPIEKSRAKGTLSPLIKLTACAGYNFSLWRAREDLGLRNKDRKERDNLGLIDKSKDEEDGGEDLVFNVPNLGREATYNDIKPSSFSLKTVISSGSYGKVYQALSSSESDGTVALKVMDNKEPWKIETNNLSKLCEKDPDDPNTFEKIPYLLVPIASYETSIAASIDKNNKLVREPMYAIATEYVPYPSLNKSYDSFDRSFEKIAAIIWKILCCLEGFKKRKMVHADIKPSNVLLKPPSATSEAEVTVIDVGLATLTGTLKKYTQSRYYRDPIPVMGGKLTASSDLFSLGCMIYELLTKHFLFYSSPLVEMLSENSSESSASSESSETLDKSEREHNIMHLMLVFAIIGYPSDPKFSLYNDDYFEKCLGTKVFRDAEKEVKFRATITKRRLKEAKERLNGDPEQLAIFGELEKFMYFLLNYNEKKTAAEAKNHPFMKRFTKAKS